jgi:hypothetical protein
MASSRGCVWHWGSAVYISELRIENFRMFGEGNEALILVLRPGLSASDALRLGLESQSAGRVPGSGVGAVGK